MANLQIWVKKICRDVGLIWSVPGAILASVQRIPFLWCFWFHKHSFVVLLVPQHSLLRQNESTNGGFSFVPRQLLVSRGHSETRLTVKLGFARRSRRNMSVVNGGHSRLNICARDFPLTKHTYFGILGLKEAEKKVGPNVLAQNQAKYFL
eukprot:g74710.t1